MALIQRLDGLKAAITLPPGLPAWSTYFLWPKNSLGYGSPVAVNRTEAWWIGSDQATQGDTVSVYGRNLSHNNGATTSWVYIQPAGASGQWATVTSVNPYRVQFTVPNTLSNGTYQVWIHNGHGGSYGWSGPLTLTVTAPYVWDSGSDSTFNPNSPPPSTSRITAPKAMAVPTIPPPFIRPAGDAGIYQATHPGSHPTVYFPAGAYLTSQSIGMDNNTRYLGAE